MSRNRFRPSSGPKNSRLVQTSPSITGPESTNHEHPLFDLQHLTGRACVTECTTQERADFALALHKLSKLTWQQIQGAQRHGLGHEKIYKADLKNDELRSKTPSDRDYLLAFRFSGNAPFLGYRDGRIFVVLGLDRDFTAYKH